MINYRMTICGAALFICAVTCVGFSVYSANICGEAEPFVPIVILISGILTCPLSIVLAVMGSRMKVVETP